MRPSPPKGSGEIGGKQAGLTNRLGVRYETEGVGSFTKGPNTGFPRSFERNWDVSWYPGSVLMVPIPNGWVRGELLRKGMFAFRPNPALGLHAYDPTEPGQWSPAGIP